LSHIKLGQLILVPGDTSLVTLLEKKSDPEDAAKIIEDAVTELRIYLGRYFEIKNGTAFVNAEHAYRGSYIVLNVEKGISRNSLFHELTHLLLFSYGRPVFYLREGLACLISYLFSGEKELSKIHLTDEKCENIKVEELLDFDKPEYFENIYYDAALYHLRMLYERTIMGVVAECYKDIGLVKKYYQEAWGFLL